MKKRTICILLMLILSFCMFCSCSIVEIETENETAITTVEEESASVSEEIEVIEVPDITDDTEDTEVSEESDVYVIDEDGIYTSCEDVSLYIYTYRHLPDNFITKVDARALGWEGGSLEPYAPGMCIGGDYFGNYEHLLPEASGREYHECDVDTLEASSRGAHRIIYSNDGLIYCTEDHYESFTLLYGEEA
ncbi:MAG: ribonuclease [Saccharofermentans sp.]|nr:ribonuclease [Saccharofermentans sp.]